MKLPHSILGVVVLAAAPAAAQTNLGPLNLPGSYAPFPFAENFEAAAGVVPPYMALTALNSTTLVPDPEAWCNIGNLGACMNPYSGLFALENGFTQRLGRGLARHRRAIGWRARRAGCDCGP